ncbi:MAG: sugar phosphate isomerase/epimerase [Chitinophagaceae bacterium]
MMHYSRRKFIQQSGLALAAAAIVPKGLLAHATAKETLGLQLYSVRDDMKKDPAGTLKQLAAMGYKHVEHANYVDHKFYGYEQKEFKKLLDGLGLKMPSGHTRMNAEHWDAAKKDFTDAWKKTVDDAAAMGQQYVISPWLEDSLRKNYDDLVRYMEVFNKSGELCKKAGMKFGYHNHDFEFSVKLNDTTVFDIILKNTDPSLVMQQLDIGNMYNAGAKALDIVKKYPGRFVSMHVKDEIKSVTEHSPYESTVLGKGILPVKEIIDLGRKAGGTSLFIIEQESYQGISPLDCAKEDLAVMNKWGYK